jgi:hypothetical protein
LQPWAENDGFIFCFLISPDRNPDELAGKHLKTDTAGRMAIAGRDDVKRKLRSSMRQRQGGPGKIRSF